MIMLLYHILVYMFTHHIVSVLDFFHIFFTKSTKRKYIYIIIRAYINHKKKIYFFKILFYYTIFVFSLSLSSVYSRNHYYTDFEYYVNGVLRYLSVFLNFFAFQFFSSIFPIVFLLL